MTIMIAGLHQRETWNEVVESAPHAFAHTWESCSFYEANNSDKKSYLAYMKSERNVAYLPFVESASSGSIDLQTPYGFSGLVTRGIDPEAFFRSWREYCERRSYTAAYLCTHPVLSSKDLVASPDYFEEKKIFIVDLTRDEEALRKSVKRRRRSQLALPPDARFIDDKVRLIERFLPLYQSLLKRVGTAATYQFSQKSFEALFEGPGVYLLGVEVGCRLVSIDVFTHSPYMADFFLNGSDDDGKQYSSALMWRAMMHFREGRIAHFNLGGGISPGDSVERYKSYFGGEAVHFGALKQVYDQETYNRRCKSAGLPPEKGGYFPPYRRPPAPAQSHR